MRTPRDLALGWRDALLARDGEAFGRLFAADAVMVDVEHRTPDGRAARPLVGRPEIQAVAETWFREVGAFDYVVDEVLADPSRAAVRWTPRRVGRHSAGARGRLLARVPRRRDRAGRRALRRHALLVAAG